MNKPLRCFDKRVSLVDLCSLHFDSPSDRWLETYTPFPWFSSSLIPHLPHSPSPILSPLFSPRPGVYTVKLYIVFFSPHLRRSMDVGATPDIISSQCPSRTFHDRSRRVFLFLLPCSISHPLHWHLLLIHISPLSLSFFRQTYSSIFSLCSGHKRLRFFSGLFLFFNPVLRFPPFTFKHSYHGTHFFLPPCL